MAKTKPLGDRIHEAAERHFKRRNGLDVHPWPTVRQLAKRLRVTQAEIVDEAEGWDGLMLTSWFTSHPQAQGDHFVETI